MDRLGTANYRKSEQSTILEQTDNRLAYELYNSLHP
jgi:hypothetical protein